MNGKEEKNGKHFGKTGITLAVGMLIGSMVLSPLAAAASDYLQAKLSSQKFTLNGQQIEMQAYSINGNNYVKLRDIGEKVGFAVDYDGKTNTVVIDTEKPYTAPETSDKVAAPTAPVKANTAATCGVKRASDGTVTLPTDGSNYELKVGDILVADNDGARYKIKDVSRWNKNAFADGPLPALPTPTCDWSLLDQPELPKPEVRHFTVGNQEYLFVCNVYETCRMLGTLYNAIGDNSETWQDGKPILRKDGSQMVRIHLTIPDSIDPAPFWPWKPEAITEYFNAVPFGDIYMQAWDVYKDGVFQKTEYDLQ